MCLENVYTVILFYPPGVKSLFNYIRMTGAVSIPLKFTDSVTIWGNFALARLKMAETIPRACLITRPSTVNSRGVSPTLSRYGAMKLICHA